MTYSLCITTYNRYELLLESYAQIIDDERISEVIIVDDCSTPDIRAKLQQLPKLNSKIKVFFQPVNRGMSRNKADSISYATNEWCIIFDSDNILKEKYLDAIPETLEGDVIYSPSFAQPSFDFSAYEGVVVNRNNIKMFMPDPMFRCFLNCCNYLVHRDSYLNVYEDTAGVEQADTINFNYLWLKNGGSFLFMKDCPYFHRVHKNSAFLENIDYNMIKAKEIENKILAL